MNQLISFKKTKSNKNLRIKINGAGPTGCLLALSLAQKGCKVNICDPLSIDSITCKSRAYALTQSSRLLLQKLQLWEQLLPYLCSFSKLTLEDCEIQKSVIFNCLDLSCLNQQSDAIGWIIEHKFLMMVIFKNILTSNNVHTSIGDSYSFDGLLFDFTVGADGINSPTRKNIGIGQYNIPYKQGCLTAKVIIRGANQNTAFEILREKGPLAILPIGKELFQVVWTDSLDNCIDRVSQTPAFILDQLAGILPEGLEPDLLLDKPAAFPVGICIAHCFYKGRTILVGEACHSFHPVGGQGLNLGLRDVSILSDLLIGANKGKINIHSLPRKYGNKRIVDVATITIFTHLLIILFSNRNRLLLSLRVIILNILSSFSYVRRFIMMIMTDGVNIIE